MKRLKIPRLPAALAGIGMALIASEAMEALPLPGFRFVVGSLLCIAALFVDVDQEVAEDLRKDRP